MEDIRMEKFQFFCRFYEGRALKLIDMGKINSFNSFVDSTGSPGSNGSRYLGVSILL